MFRCQSYLKIYKYTFIYQHEYLLDAIKIRGEDISETMSKCHVNFAINIILNNYKRHGRQKDWHLVSHSPNRDAGPIPLSIRKYLKNDRHKLMLLLPLLRYNSFKNFFKRENLKCLLG